MRIPVLACFISCFILSNPGTVLGQYEEVGLGFKAGLNFSKFDGPSETGPNGEALESFRVVNGFHIGGIVNIKFTDLVGLRTEFTYTQRGTEYEYNGPSYYTLGKNTLRSVTLMGTRNQTMKVTNAYVDIPLMSYYKIGFF